MNVVAFFHAYKFTHFAEANIQKTQHAKDLSLLDKLTTLIFGINNPRPTNKIFPAQPYQKVVLRSSQNIECWHIKIPNSKGTVVLFHGYSGNKSLMLDKSDEFIKLGYSTFLVDFIGTGGSAGNQTTIGFREAQDVKASLDYLSQQQEKNVILFGTSMGAAAILKAADAYSIQPAAAILECPFGSMYQTTCARFRQMQVPCFPMANLLVLWGGVQNGFWAYGHNPQEYARKVDFPVLLLYGEKDLEVSREETKQIFANLNGKKLLRTYPEAGHENYLNRYKQEWLQDISGFLNETIVTD
ncbi:alpha/beta hydrolase [Rhodocytophaga rosea]|uniref:Alpha/beta hydrolase n=1 Tax=Rhodocytophaga rosea TaxID=2704465 RepID=A0A6C0GDC3_9BACT|nr:alpha/beta fold hydrolase [Rhodocytophaga rosea]QHT65908.1 alpha/beta hydrolase [Rhodocytophaga rosea]